MIFDGWIHTEYRLRRPLIVLLIPGEQQELHEEIERSVKADAENPNALATALEDWLGVITQQQFPGLVVMGLSFDLSRLCWRLLVSHRAFPRSVVGLALPEWQVIPDGAFYQLGGCLARVKGFTEVLCMIDNPSSPFLHCASVFVGKPLWLLNTLAAFALPPAFPSFLLACLEESWYG